MTLETGSRLGPYEILSLIGAGGMGEVYQAKDTRLDRTVAIKVLPSHLAESPERRERFEREARAVSSLNHPHICTLHDVGEQDGTHYLVMEYIEGETLADRLTEGPLPLDQALRHGIEIADALDKAHRQGVVHRDLKPGNIMLTKSGAKLLDFGLAKLKGAEPEQAASALSALPTEQKPLTKEGSILGTFQYMSPEQLEGNEADARTDIFSFGSVLYEMVTGKPAFEGKSHASLITAIMSTQPAPISSVQPMSPPALEHAVKRCLAKEPDERWQTASDLMGELAWIATGNSGGQATAPVQERRSGSWARAVAMGLALLIVAVITGIAVWTSTRTSPPRPRRFVMNLPPMDQTSVYRNELAVTPDGRTLVYLGLADGVRQLFRRPIGQFTAEPIPGTENATNPFLSPDGEWVGFAADGELKKVSLMGGGQVTLCELQSSRWTNATWWPGDVIFFGQRGAGLQKVPASGGVPQAVTTLRSDQGERTHSNPQLLPGGKAILFSVHFGTGFESQMAVLSLDSGERRMLGEGTRPHFVPTGHLVFAREASLWAVPFDLERLDVTGAPIPVLQGVQSQPRPEFAMSRDGTLFYLPGEMQASRLVWVDREGVARPLSEPRRDFAVPRLSPNGQYLAVAIPGEIGIDIWILELERGTLTRLTFDPGSDVRPCWTPDGKEITFASDRSEAKLNIFSMPANGSGEALQLTFSDYLTLPASWSPDGRILAFHQHHTDTGWNIGILPRGGEPTIVLGTQFNERQPVFSPDGQWLAYASDESGQWEVYIRPFPDLGAKLQVSTEGGQKPVWAPNGHELFYRNDFRMMAVSVTTEPELALSVPTLLFEEPYVPTGANGGIPNYAVAPDGQHFVMNMRETLSEEMPPQVHVVLDWFEELKRLVPTN